MSTEDSDIIHDHTENGGGKWKKSINRIEVRLFLIHDKNLIFYTDSRLKKSGPHVKYGLFMKKMSYFSKKLKIFLKNHNGGPLEFFI